MRQKAHPIRRLLPAPQRAGTAWCSLLLTFVFLVGLATLGHLLGVYQSRSGSEWRGISVIPFPASPTHMPPLPDYQEPAEQSTPNIPFTPPQLVAAEIEMPDICTTPEETSTEPPLIDVPESLNAPIDTARKATRPKPRRSLASAKAAVLPAITNGPPEAETTTAPTYKNATPPPYPAEMRASRIRGVVRVRIAVNPAGVPTAVQITASSGHHLFDTTATSWILRYWRFNPATRSGVPVASSINTRVEFILDNA